MKAAGRNRGCRFEDTSRNVEDQRADPESTLNFTRDLIALRKELAGVRSGSYAELPAPPGAWAWRRGDGVVVGINLASAATEIDGMDGKIALATDRGREGEAIHGQLRLGAAEGAVVQRKR